MKTHSPAGKKERSKIFLVIVPHRDTRLILRSYLEILPETGIDGMYSFPLAAPLAALSHPFNTDELKLCARALKKDVSASCGGKFFSNSSGNIDFPVSCNYSMRLFGSRLNLEVDLKKLLNCAEGLKSPAQKINNVFSPLIIGTCLLTKDETPPPPPHITFSAAALANMYFRPVYGSKDSDVEYKWKIGNLTWLPKKVRENPI